MQNIIRESFNLIEFLIKELEEFGSKEALEEAQTRLAMLNAEFRVSLEYEAEEKISELEEKIEIMVDTDEEKMPLLSMLNELKDFYKKLLNDVDKGGNK